MIREVINAVSKIIKIKEVNKTVGLIIGIIVLIVGLFYTIMPHSIHISSGLGFGFSHGIHVTIGIVLLVIGGVILWIKRK